MYTNLGSVTFIGLGFCMVKRKGGAEYKKIKA